MEWIFWALGVDIGATVRYNKAIEGELTAQTGNPRVNSACLCGASDYARVFPYL